MSTSKPAKFVSVNSHTIRRNKKNDECAPPIAVRIVKTGDAKYESVVPIHDAYGNVVARVVYHPHAPLGCGAVVFIECYYDPQEFGVIL